MNGSLRRSLAIGTLSALIAVFFISVGILKLADPQQFAIAIRNYQLIPRPTIHVVAMVLPWWEILAGIGILLAPLRRASALLVLSMCLLFMIAVGSAMVRGLDIDCGCFGPASSKAGLPHLLLNLALCTGCAAVWRLTSKHQGLIRKKESQVSGFGDSQSSIQPQESALPVSE